MNTTAIVSPASQKVTFVELFFDLVFVFCVTQVVGVFHGVITWQVMGEGVLIFWLVWWAWTQFTWALNAADTTHHLVQLATLGATAVAFFMAVAIPGAFHGRALWFAVPYVVGRVIGLMLYAWVAAAADQRQHAAVRIFTISSLGGLIAVLMGAWLGGAVQYWFWGAVIPLDFIAASVGGKQESWNLNADHFGERHGLFVIIALGETLIVAAGGVTDTSWTAHVLVVALLAVGITCALWWTYFTRAKPALDRALEEHHGAAQSTMARDVFSLLHFPMVCGIIACAVATEYSVSHPRDALPLELRIAVALGLLLFVGGMCVAMWRARKARLGARALLTAATAVIVVAVGSVSPAVTLAIALVGVAAVAAWEQVRWRRFEIP
jgi:low temperature requirement protein LtrA